MNPDTWRIPVAREVQRWLERNHIVEQGQCLAPAFGITLQLNGPLFKWLFDREDAECKRLLWK